MKWLVPACLVLALATHRADACNSGGSKPLPVGLIAATAGDFALTVGFTIGDLAMRDHSKTYAVVETVGMLPGAAVLTVAAIAVRDQADNGAMIAGCYAAVHIGLMVHGIYTLTRSDRTAAPGTFHVGSVNASVIALPTGIGLDGTF